MSLPDIDSLSTYGGALNNSTPVEDPTTDRDANLANKAYANVAALTHTGIRAWCAFVGHATTPPDPVSNVHDAVWGNPPAVKPVVAKTGTGVYTVTFPATVQDELDATHSVNLRRAWASVEGTTPYLTTATVTSANVVTVRLFTDAGAANNAVATTITVYAI